MKIKEALDSLYNIIPLDKTLRDYKLKELLIKDKESMSILFSFQYHVEFAHSKINVEPNDIELKDIDIYRILLDIVNSYTFKEASDKIKMLKTEHQVVLRQLISTNSIYPMPVIYEHIYKLYTLPTLKEELLAKAPQSNKIPYIVTDYPLQYTYRSNSFTFSNIKNKTNRPNVPKSFCFLTSGDKVVVKGDKTLYKYMNGRVFKPNIFTKLKTCEEEEISEIKENNKGRWVTTFGDYIICEFIPNDEIVVTPYDWTSDIDFNPDGFVFKWNDNVYKIRHKVTQKLFKKGIGSFDIRITYRLHHNKLSKIKVTEIIEKGDE